MLLKAVRFLYGDQLEVQGADIPDFTRFADMYDISSIRKVCETVLFESVNAKVVIYLWQFALHYHSVKLADQCKEFSLKNFKNIMTRPGFLECDDNILLTLLSDRHLKISREDCAVEAIINWVAHKESERAQHLQELFSKCIRTANVSSAAVHARLEVLGNSHFNEATKIAVMSLLRHASNVAIFDREILPPRACTSYVDCLRLCLNSHDRISTCALFENDDGDLQEVCCQNSVGPASVRMSNVFDLGSHGQDVFMSISSDHMCVYHTYALAINWTNAMPVPYPIMKILMFDDGKLLTVYQGDPQQIILDMWPNIEALSRLVPGHGIMTKYSPGQLIAVERYGNYIIVFSLGAGKLNCTALDSYDLDGICKLTSYAVINSGDLMCSTAKDSIACLVCSDAIVFINMDDVMRYALAKSGQIAKSTVPEGPIRIHKATVTSPVPSAGKQLCSATIYGQHLYIAETPLTNNQLKLHVTDFNQLVKLEDDAAPVWSSKIVQINNSVRDHFGNNLDNNITVQLTSKQVKNALNKA